MTEQPVTFRGRVDRSIDPSTPGEKTVEADDPYELVGVRYPVPEGVDADRELARCFVEDYALMGWGPDRIRQLFATEFFGGTYDIARRRGSELVENAIATVFGTGDPSAVPEEGL